MGKDKRKEIKELISRTKSYEGMEGICGAWDGETVLKEIKDTLEERDNNCHTPMEQIMEEPSAASPLFSCSFIRWSQRRFTPNS